MLIQFCNSYTFKSLYIQTVKYGYYITIIDVSPIILIDLFSFTNISYMFFCCIYVCNCMHSCTIKVVACQRPYGVPSVSKVRKVHALLRKVRALLQIVRALLTIGVHFYKSTRTL